VLSDNHIAQGQEVFESSSKKKATLTGETQAGMKCCCINPQDIGSSTSSIRKCCKVEVGDRSYGGMSVFVYIIIAVMSFAILGWIGYCCYTLNGAQAAQPSNIAAAPMQTQLAAPSPFVELKTPGSAAPAAAAPPPAAPPAAAPQFCMNCGAAIQPGTKFCGSCGHPTGA
jgi:hypothetical protein